jgi:alpha-D-ribose 1-methylphosphonate 5-phosphate C-P lyase
MTGVQTTTHALEASLIQSRHRIPEEILGQNPLLNQVLILQVPMPEVLSNAGAEASYSKAREMHADSEYELLFLRLYEDLITYFRSTHGADYPVWVNGRYAMAPSPIPRWDTLKLHQAAHLTLLSAGREKRLYAVPPYTNVRPLEFEDVPFQVEDQRGWHSPTTGIGQAFMNEIPLEGGASSYEISDSDYREKVQVLLEQIQNQPREQDLNHDKTLNQNQNQTREQDKNPLELGETYFDEHGEFYISGVLKVIL